MENYCENWAEIGTFGGGLGSDGGMADYMLVPSARLLVPLGDMRVRGYIQAPAHRQNFRPHLVEKDERSDHSPICVRKNAAQFKTFSQLARARFDYKVNCGLRRFVSIHKTRFLNFFS
jgi:hypothetical protein